jgi:hypothetical protein
MREESPRDIEIGPTNVGIGLICTRRHEVGDLLLSERPLLSVPGDVIPEGWVATNATWRLVEALSRLQGGRLYPRLQRARSIGPTFILVASPVGERPRARLRR